MDIFHKIMPDISRVRRTFQCRKFFWHIIAYPYTGRIVARVADKPSVFIVVGRSGLARAWHLTDRQSLSGSLLHNGNQHVGHHPCRVFFVDNGLLLIRHIDVIAVRIRDLDDAGRLPVFSAVFQCRVSRCHLKRGHASRKSTQGSCHLLILIFQMGKVHISQIGDPDFRRQLLKQAPRHCIFGRFHRLAQCDLSGITLVGVGRPTLRLLIIYNRIRRITALQRRCIHDERLDRASRLTEALVSAV